MADPRSASILTQSQTPATPKSFGYGSSAQRPASPDYGFLYWDTTLNREVVYTAIGWQIIGVQPAAMVGYGTTAQRPAAPVPGFVYYDTTLAAQFTWTGSGWIRTSPTPAPSMTGAGSTEQRPTNVALGYLYFDTTLQRQLVWAGAEWVVIGPIAPASIPAPAVPVPVITSSSSIFGTNLASLSYQVVASNTPTSYAISVTPPNLTFSTTTGLLSGTANTYSGWVTFTATNAAGSGSLSAYVNIVASGGPTPPAAYPPVITSSTSIAGAVDTAINYQIVATNTPTSYSVGAGTLPTGLSLNTTTGLISGTPTGVSSVSVTLTATNATGSGSISFYISVVLASGDPGIPVISGALTVYGVVNSAFSYQFSATNYPSSYSIDGAATTALGLIGLTLNTATGYITGTPTGTYSGPAITLGATNSIGTGTATLNLTVTAAPVTSGRWTSTLATCSIYPAYLAIAGVTLENSDPSIVVLTITAESGDLPPGVTYQVYDPNSTLLGTATTAGGEANVGANFTVNQGGGYGVLVSTASSSVKLRISLSVTGAKFSNSSITSVLLNFAITGDIASGQTSLTIAGVDPTTQIASADFSEVSIAGGNYIPTGVYLTAPGYVWNLGGSTNVNPNTDFTQGLTSLTLTGAGPGVTAPAGVVLAVNG